MEQSVTRLLFDLVALGMRVTLAFVFSHVGGAPGNDAADELAEKAREQHGGDWYGIPLWHTDTSRRINNNYHRAVDRSRIGKGRFRFKNMPCEFGGAPSERLPQEMPRAHERLVYRARLGMMTSAGGLLHDAPESCPLCREPGAMGREGATIEHLVKCLPRYTWGPPLEIDLRQLWTEPALLGEQLSVANQIVERTEVGAARALEYRTHAARRARPRAAR